ncbi:hypothetical protein EUGRSUZ_E00147 [Eucalyptus grandis]|uniref:Uncharacterized protein n=2 Tax=Eucalyptus grandis TaxID=71139 RepID=A0ACC3KR83_EUCGR|nr:hypothetical protein EUGRSUZ_E00147 [Eucalyptus grandis]
MISISIHISRLWPCKARVYRQNLVPASFQMCLVHESPKQNEISTLKLLIIAYKSFSTENEILPKSSMNKTKIWSPHYFPCFVL